MASSRLSRFVGCVLGLALGDALGAPHEGGLAERLLWRAIGTTRAGKMRWTDDTQMSIDVAESLVALGSVDPDDLAARFARSYRWSRGYGPAASKVLKRIAAGHPWDQANRSVYRDGSFGNGAAMRAPVIGLFYADRPDELQDAARRAAVVTHAHPLGVEGAVLIAGTTAAALRNAPTGEILRLAFELSRSDELRPRLNIARSWLESGERIVPEAAARNLGNGIAAAGSCVTALYLALRFREAGFLDLQRFVAAVGGDADTIGAMAGAIWGAARGAADLPHDLLDKLEARDRLLALAGALSHRAGGA